MKSYNLKETEYESFLSNVQASLSKVLVENDQHYRNVLSSYMMRIQTIDKCSRPDHLYGSIKLSNGKQGFFLLSIFNSEFHFQEWNEKGYTKRFLYQRDVKNYTVQEDEDSKTSVFEDGCQKVNYRWRFSSKKYQIKNHRLIEETVLEKRRAVFRSLFSPKFMEDYTVPYSNCCQEHQAFYPTTRLSYHITKSIYPVSSQDNEAYYVQNNYGIKEIITKEDWEKALLRFKKVVLQEEPGHQKRK